MPKNSEICRQTSRVALAISVVGGAFLSVFPNAAHAQDASESSETGIADIVVTAERRAASAQKTPVTLTVVDGDTLAKNGVIDVQELTAYVPSLQIGEAGRAAMQIAIRGVYSANNDGDPSAAFHVDGLYYTRPSSGNAVFYDLERIEVLRGPQGTLWGRNATSGAINVITRKPEGGFSGAFEVGYGNYDAWRMTGSLNVPIVKDKWAVRGAFLFSDRDAYEFNTAPNAPHPGVKDVAFRLHSLFTPSEQVSLLVSGDYWHNKGQSITFIDPRPGYSRRRSPSSTLQDIEAYSLHAELTVDFNEVQFVSLTGYRKEDNIGVGGVYPSLGGGLYNLAGFVRNDISAYDSTFSQEVRLSSTGDGPFTWTLGGIYIDESLDERFRIVFAPNVTEASITRPNQSSRSYGLFGNMKFALTETVSLIGGLRYSDDKKKNIGGQNVRLTNGVASTTTENVAGSWNRLDWKAGIDWQVAPRSLLYATVSTGYKAGGIANSVYEPEKLLAFEVGTKNQIFDSRLQLNAALFAYKYTDLQVGKIQNLRLVTDNASSASIKGAELEFQAIPVEGVRLSGSLSYIDGEYRDYAAVNTMAGNAIVQVGGNPLQRAPKLSTRLGTSYSFDVPGGKMTIGGDWAYQSKIYFSEFANLGGWALLSQKPVSTFNADARYEFADGKYFISAYIRNARNKDVLASSSFYTPTRSTFGMYAPPRTYGLRIGATF